MSLAVSAAPQLEPSFEGDFTLPGDFVLEAGGVLREPVLHYALYGQPAAEDNVVLVCHALSGSARIGDWWPALLAPGGLLQPERDCIVGVNILGSCYGSTGPASHQSRSRVKLYGSDFPLVTIGDIVRAQAALFDALGMHTLQLAIGASIGGMQVLEWSVRYPERVKRAVVIGAAPLNGFGLAMNHLQRSMIRLDPDWHDGRFSPDAPPRTGLSLARQLATVTYKSPELFTERFARKPDRSGEDPRRNTGLGREGRFDVAGYLDSQGAKFNDRFDARSYIAITRAMDLFEMSDSAAAEIEADLTLVGLSSDLLFPAEDVRALAHQLTATGAQCDYRELVSNHGHDAFLAEPEALIELLQQ